MEKAIHITNLEKLKFFQKKRFQRVYWGAEFCQNLIPGLKSTEKIARFAEENHFEFTFVTPFVTERGLIKLKEMFYWFKKNRKMPEIVVNDWGVLECLNSEFKGYFKLSLGRLLTRQQRDPAIKTILEKQSPLAVKGKNGEIRILVHRVPDTRYQKGIKASYINTSYCAEFLSKFGVERVELNNLMQGTALEGIELKKSIYTPFVNISTSRFCPMETRFQKIYRVNVCAKECQKYYTVLRNRAIPKIIYKRGGTTFYKNPLNTKKALNTAIDRIVFQEDVPQ
jgi:hypothetical protein